MRCRTVFAGLLAVAVAGGAPAAPAQALDLAGTITVREVTTKAIGGTKDVTTAWTLRGRLRGEAGYAVAPATPSVRAYADVTRYVHADGEPVCDFTTFDGWFPGPQNPVVQDLMLDLPARDVLAGRATGSLTLLGLGPLALTSSGSCGAAAEPADPVSLLASDIQSPGLYRRALMGEGNLTVRRGRSTTVLGPGEYLAPGAVTFRRSLGRWRADGARTRIGSYAAGILGSGTKTVRVEWHLTSRTPTNVCTLPRPALVRGKTIAHARRVLRRAGFRAGATLSDFGASVPRGRVSALADRGGGTERCGGRVELWISR